jgi:ABC-2 type transport system permease protein
LILPFFYYLPFLYFGAQFRFDVGPVISSAIGLTTMGMMLVSIGLFFSSLTKNQIIAAVMTFSTAFLLIVVTQVAFSFAMMTRRTTLAEGVQFVSVVHQLNTFSTGQLDLRFLALHLSVSILMLYLTVKVLEYRRES